jgi:hypothetical protein
MFVCVGVGLGTQTENTTAVATALTGVVQTDTTFETEEELHALRWE